MMSPQSVALLPHKWLALLKAQTKTLTARSRYWLAMLFFALLLVSCRKETQPVQLPAGNGGQLRPYTAQLEADDGQWVRATKDYANSRYSTLDQINTGNVDSLKVAWTFDTGVARGQEAAPIVANNTMYVVAPWPNTLFALDLTKPGGPLKWKFEPNPSPAAKGQACCDWVNRGAVFDSGKIFYNTLDGYT
jgi:glucose dehydrogenase